LKLKQNFIADNFQPIEKYINGKYDKKVKHKKKKNGINITIRSNGGRYATLFKNNQLYSCQKDKGLTGHLFPFKNVEKNTKYLLLLKNRITYY
tara:strand:- start:1007 stop:1285 length:279 start_codon:yes stop_codon:yes gene_type:complete